MALRTDGTYEVDPISRIEGHLGIKVTTTSGLVTDVQAHGNLFRGFENFLLGRAVNDAITFTQRICGVCPVPHGLTSTHAVDTVLGYSRGHITFANTDATDTDAAGNNYGIPPRALLIRNLVAVADTMMSTITHFYHLVAPSYVQGPGIPPWTPFFADSQYHGLLVNEDNAALPAVPELGNPDTWTSTNNKDVWNAVIISYVRALRVRRLVFEAGALFAGRMPMTSCFVGGGVTNDYSENIDLRIAKYKELMTEVAGFVLSEYIPIALTLGLLYPNFDNAANAALSPFTDGTKPVAIGAGLGQFLAWGAYPNLDNTLTSKGGVAGLPSGNFTVANKAQVYSTWLTGVNSVPSNLKEHIESSRYAISAIDTTAAVYGADQGAYPGVVARTRPDRGHGYSYIKSPRWNGYAMEVGPLARLVVGGVYPTSGSLWATGLLAAAAGYYFVNTTPGSAQLDGTKIAPTIVAALVNAGVLNGDGTGTVAEWILGLNGGLSTMDRIRARALEAVALLDKAINILGLSGTAWIDEPILGNVAEPTCRNLPIPVGTVQGWGAHEAARGALMHQAKITGGKIVAYQCIVPTTWNGAPKTTLTARGLQRGAIEAACMGAPYDAATQTFTTQAGTASAPTQGGVEVLRIAQSFDPCIACAVH